MITVLYMMDEAPLELYRFLERERLERIERNIRSDANSVASAGLLLAYAAVKTANLKLPLKIVRGAKPYLKGRDFEFSLSHTTGLAACAYSDSPVGVDAEFIRTMPVELFKKLNLPNSADSDSFFTRWTALESIYKLHGGKFKLNQITLATTKSGFIDSFGNIVTILKTGNYIISTAGTEPVDFIKVSTAELKDILKTDLK